MDEPPAADGLTVRCIHSPLRPQPGDDAIRAESVRIGPRAALVATGSGSPENHGRVHLEDVVELDERTRDRDRDGMLHADGPAVPLTPGMAELCVRGTLGPGAGTSFFGCDAVEVVP